jgi:BirA family biotin operon repressor/biotin-[acetyl-CoA-carboxylase] ligase
MKILEFEKLESTQKKAKEILKNSKAWTTILAKEQTGGYGRKGNFWYSPKGGLYFSVILPKTKIKNLQILTFLAAFCVAKVLNDKFGVKPFIKWPNDVWLNGKKICGILTENLILGKNVEHSIIGIGLNTNIDQFPKDLNPIATSVKIELKKKIDNEMILKKILNEIKEIFKIIS